MNPICHIPWTWLEIDIDKKIIRNCCKTNWITDPEFLLFNNPSITKRRTDFLQGIKSDDCNHCWKLEEGNQISYRQYTKHNPYLQTDIFDINTVIPVTLTINLGSLCNMSCTYCNEEYSTVWAVEKNIPIKLTIINHFEEKILLWLENIIINDKLKHIILIGGEPTINPSFYKILSLLENLSPTRLTSLKITVQTNGMFSHRQLSEIIDKSQISNCTFTYRFSIDGVGKRAEFIRTGLIWDKFLFNFENLINSPVNVAVHPTLSVLSLGGLDEFLSWLSTYNYQWESLGQNHIEGPLGLSLRSLGRYSTELLPKLSFYKNKSLQNYAVRTAMFVNSFKQDPNLKSIKDCLDYHKNRSTIPIEDAAPELLTLLNKYNV